MTAPGDTFEISCLQPYQGQCYYLQSSTPCGPDEDECSPADDACHYGNYVSNDCAIP